jgi:hypothetical protein
VPGGPNARTAERFRLLVGGHVGGAGQHLGQHVQQLRPFPGREGGHDAALQRADARQQPIGGRAAGRRDLDQDTAPVGRVGDAADPAALFQ